jgi:hypothetical protein
MFDLASLLKKEGAEQISPYSDTRGIIIVVRNNNGQLTWRYAKKDQPLYEQVDYGNNESAYSLTNELNQLLPRRNHHGSST